MHKTKDELYLLVQNLISKEEFEAEIKKRGKEFGELLNEQALAHLIVDEMGKNVVNFCKILELENVNEATIFAKVTSILGIRDFTRKNGTKGKVANLQISDKSGRCKLVLWDTKQVELVENRKIDVGTKLKIVNGKVKKSQFGLEISIRHRSLLIIEPEDFPIELEEIKLKKFTDLKDIKLNKNLNVCGTIINKSRTRIFTRRDGSNGFVSDITIFDGTANATVILWNKKAKEIENFDVGDNIEIINCYAKERNGNLEIHTSRISEIKKRNSK